MANKVQGIEHDENNSEHLWKVSAVSLHRNLIVQQPIQQRRRTSAKNTTPREQIIGYLSTTRISANIREQLKLSPPFGTPLLSKDTQDFARSILSASFCLHGVHH